MSNLNMIKLECLNNIAVCSYIMKDYNNVLEKTTDVTYYFVIKNHYLQLKIPLFKKFNFPKKF